MAKASSISLDSHISMLLKGPWGYGKTLAAASFALQGPVFLAYWDKKSPIELVNYFSKFGSKGKKILDNLEYEVYGAHNAGQYLDKVKDLSKNGCKYTAVITDSVTRMTSAAVNWSLNYGKKGSAKVTVEGVTPDFGEYKVETSLVAQALDLFIEMPTTVIWIAHPVPAIKVEGSGGSMKVTKVNPIVSYGSKVAGIVPGSFSEIYHFGKISQWDNTGKSHTKYIISCDAIGDDYAKSNIGLTGDIDVTDRLFYEAWQEKVTQHKEKINDLTTEQSNLDPIDQMFQTNQSNQQTDKKWNPEKGIYE